MSAGTGTAPGAGALGEEVLRLLADLSAARTGHAHAEPQSEPEADASGTPRPSCDWCPLCRLLDLVRETSPEALAHLGDALEALAALARTLGEHARPPDAPRSDQTPRPDGRTVETIDLAEDDSWH